MLLGERRLEEAEAAASRAIETVPHPDPAMFELRSCIRLRQCRYAPALADALSAQKIPRGVSASAKVREGRAL